MRLLRSEKMGAPGGKYVGPPVPSGDEQKNRKKNRVRGKKEGDFAVGEAKGPGDLGRDIITNGAGEDAAQRAEKCLRVLWFGLDPRPEFGIQRLFRPSIDYLSRAAFLGAGLHATKDRSVSDKGGLHRGVLGVNYDLLWIAVSSASRSAFDSKGFGRLGWNSPGEAAFQDLVYGAAQCIEPSRRKIDLGAEFGIGIVLSYALKEVEARCAVTYRGDSVPISECRYHFRAHCGTRPFLLGVSEKRGK